MKKNFYAATAIAFFLLNNGSVLNAQLSLSGQIRTRTELRDGYGSPLPVGASPAFFTSQRSRLCLAYSAYRLKIGLVAQDVRVWGQDASTINRFTTQDNNAFMLHEAWAELALTDTSNKTRYVGLKLGRQEISYDDQRLLGNLDWLQQARRHDAAVFKFGTKLWTLHARFAFNQNKEAATGTRYNSTPPAAYAGNTNGASNYKSLQYLYAMRRLPYGSLSFLFLSDDFSKYHFDSSNAAVKVWDNGVYSRATVGLYFTNAFKKLTVTASAYYQTGKTFTGQKIKGELLSLSGAYSLTKSITIGAGTDYTSGGKTASYSKAFDPLYGTPHKFWGAMDYFYASSPFGERGLIDYYVKSKFKASSRAAINADVHHFQSASDILVNNISLAKTFGTELDLTASYSLTPIIGFEAGYAHFFSTATLVSAPVKNVANARLASNWAYVSINIKPDFLVSK